MINFPGKPFQETLKKITFSFFSEAHWVRQRIVLVRYEIVWAPAERGKLALMAKDRDIILSRYPEVSFTLYILTYSNTFSLELESSRECWKVFQEATYPPVRAKYGQQQRCIPEKTCLRIRIDYTRASGLYTSTSLYVYLSVGVSDECLLYD